MQKNKYDFFAFFLIFLTLQYVHAFLTCIVMPSNKNARTPIYRILALFFGSLRSSNYQTITTRFSQEASDNMLTRLD